MTDRCCRQTYKIDRLQQQVDVEQVKEVLSFMWVSRAGVSAEELIALVGMPQDEFDRIHGALDGFLINRTGLLVPVVQYTPTPECFDARPLAQRIRAEKAGESRGRLDVFQTPEPALRELSTLLDLSVNRPASKKSKKKKSKAATT